MTDFSQLVQQSTAKAWLFLPSAIALGALHGLEPGHSKSVMAAFIITVRGTVVQAVMLGLAATVSHTAVVWAVAMGGLYLGQGWGAAATEPYLQLVSAALIAATAFWMLHRTWRVVHVQQHVHGMRMHHDHAHPGDAAATVLDSHAQAHADEIAGRFQGREVTSGQILLCGLTGGLIPCPASVTVLLLCLQLKEVALGATLVLGFSVGLALTMVASGALAALSMRHAARHGGQLWPVGRQGALPVWWPDAAGCQLHGLGRLARPAADGLTPPWRRQFGA